MRNRQHTLLASVAALALFAASGMAFAQQNQQEQKGAGGAAQSNTQSQRGEQGTKNQAAGQGLKNQGAQQGKNQSAKNQSAMSKQSSGKQSSGQNARNESKMQSKQTGAAANMTGKSNAGKGEKSANRSTQELKQNKGASTAKTTQSKTGQSKTGQFANQPQGKQQLKGLQGSTRAPMQGATATERGAGAANVSLNEQQRTQIRDTVINSRSAPRVSNVDFSVNVGTVVPRGHIHLVRVPETLIRIEPRWRHYLYFVFNNEIVIVEPRTMRIIQVLPV
jgi:Protein of unknown function (DUF1236)